MTLGWNVVGVIVLAALALTASSVALAGFGLDSFIEIGASAVVLWELSRTGEARQRRALRIIGVAVVGRSARRVGHRVLRGAGGGADLPGASLSGRVQ